MDEDTYIDWGEIFFILHRYCNLDKWKIWEYTLPQITELMKKANKHIQFEITLKSVPIGFLGGSAEDKPSSADDGEYKEATEEDIMLFSKLLGGGL